jgi:hypothetical protein
LDRVFDAASKSLDRPMDAVEFFRVLAPAVAAIKCGHANATLPEAFRKEINNTFPLLPFQVRVLNGRAYIFRDFADLGNPGNKPRALAGREIRSINGIPAAKIVATMLSAVPAEGDVQSSRQARIGSWTFNGYLFGLVGVRSPFELVLACGGNREQTVRVDGSASEAARGLEEAIPRGSGGGPCR